MTPALRSGMVDLWVGDSVLQVDLSREFLAEIEERQQALLNWEFHRATSEETLAEAPPRLHLYLFMDRALPMMAYRDPTNFVRLLDSPVGGKFLHCVWDAIGRKLDPSEYIELEWNYAKYTPAADTDILFLRFSPPVQESEVWMVAVVVRPGKKRLFLPAPPQCRYYTLETGVKVRDGDQLMFWEWEKGLHRICSYLPAESKPEDFLNEVAVDCGIL